MHAEEVERYEEMQQAMKSVAMLDTELDFTERSMLITAYKHIIGERRRAWRILKMRLGKMEEDELHGEGEAKTKSA
jgi:14-3-3 protein epsilon